MLAFPPPQVIMVLGLRKLTYIFHQSLKSARRVETCEIELIYMVGFAQTMKKPKEKILKGGI